MNRTEGASGRPMARRLARSLVTTVATACALSVVSISSAQHQEYTLDAPIVIGGAGEIAGIADLNGDRLDDLYFRIGQSSLAVRLQRPDGSLSPPIGLALGTGGGEAFDATVEAGDLNGDGINDLAYGTGYRVDVFLADGSDGFLPARSYADGHVATVEAIADIDADGHADILSTGNRENSILLGDGEGSFSGRKVLPNTEYRRDKQLLYSDVSGDGHKDIIALSRSATWKFSVAKGDGHGEFQPRVYYTTGMDIGASFAHMVAGDVDGDGLNELVLSQFQNNADGHGIWIMDQNAVGDLVRGRTLVDGAYSDLGSLQLILHDLNADGRSDLLSRQYEASSYYLQGAAGLPVQPTVFWPDDLSTGPLASGDLNDDGCSDVAESGSVESDDVTQIYLGRNCHTRRVASDFDGDGQSDLLWHHAGNGANVIWRSADVQAQQSVTRITSADWFVAGTGDFDGDGTADIVWRNRATGAGTIWKSGKSSTQQALTRITDPAWKVVGVGDFDGDGRSDLLWRHAASGANAIWRGGDFNSQQPVTGVSGAGWRVAGVGDFDGDDRDDIFWRHGTLGRNTIWLAADAAHQQPVAMVTNPDWQVAGIGDFDGDGKDDAFWRFRGSGINVIWGSGSHARRLHVAEQPGSWALAAVADYDGNGKDDVLWRRIPDGRNVLWLGAAITVPQAVATVSDTQWQVSP